MRVIFLYFISIEYQASATLANINIQSSRLLNECMADPRIRKLFVYT